MRVAPSRAKVVKYDGMMLLLPPHADVSVTLLDGEAAADAAPAPAPAEDASAPAAAGADAAAAKSRDDGCRLGWEKGGELATEVGYYQVHDQSSAGFPIGF